MAGETVKSPCIGVCTLDSDFVCRGCGRTIEEILHWREYTDIEKREINTRLRTD